MRKAIDVGFKWAIPLPKEHSRKSTFPPFVNLISVLSVKLMLLASPRYFWEFGISGYKLTPNDLTVKNRQAQPLLTYFGYLIQSGLIYSHAGAIVAIRA